MPKITSRRHLGILDQPSPTRDPNMRWVQIDAALVQLHVQPHEMAPQPCRCIRSSQFGLHGEDSRGCVWTGRFMVAERDEDEEGAAAARLGGGKVRYEQPRGEAEHLAGPR